ncbi:MarR family winged helix-turn-helix transcriptional regulator [Sphingobacterium faecium]|jgi:DNA-binding MarR family transcriptional regulator|uniref:MarR family winged helix-turn-helix transcriptional regulator n=1 Tax=Sphingobacterium faecium TaxID=34087 RepID=UPI00097EC6CA|nr:MarR family transcriptional regulator [Sphingobacterium faecium]UZJ63314.1 MarR family transcriptional regulator [Sphingobacterium sp. KU25419]SJN45881.1 Organic hydroperoxide resistance transcriptional regulator [Sphingobacterium faecium PCAi_F2.5]MQP27952.1 MarR family transcriptional regulator [Sphingobacterium faecium]PTX11888.1 DNA-binding MarR family transcriptional regulator [Sphingobacterium faecium]WGQ13835.1 MarR family transcriptional regulator [Sphingobacterium faecium]
MKDLLKLDNQLCFPLYALSREIIQRYRPHLDEIGLTYPQYLVLMVLWENDKQTVNQIGHKLLLDSGTLTPLLKRLEQKQIVLRQRSTVDERVVEISLTNMGIDLKKKAKCIPEKLIQELEITQEEIDSIRSIADKILKLK